MENNSNGNIEEIVKEYDKNKKRNLKRGFFIAFICIGAALIVSAFLFRTQYPMTLKNVGQRNFSYDHILMRDIQHFNALNKYTGHNLRYYIVYRSGEIYYEYETDLVTYSSYANRENVSVGITDHSAIQETVSKYTFLADNGKTYCYNEKTGVLHALFDAGNETGKFYLRAICYAAGAALIVVFALKLKKIK